jgi:tRNA-dihydrouridine synthase
MDVRFCTWEVRSVYRAGSVKTLASAKDHLEDLGIDGRIILEWILGNCWEVVDWTHLTQDRDHFRSVVNTEMELSCSIKGGEPLD